MLGGEEVQEEGGTALLENRLSRCMPGGSSLGQDGWLRRCPELTGLGPSGGAAAMPEAGQSQGRVGLRLRTVKRGPHSAVVETPRRQLWAQIPSARSGVPSKGYAPTAAVNLSPGTTGPQQTLLQQEGLLREREGQRPAGSCPAQNSAAAAASGEAPEAAVWLSALTGTSARGAVYLPGRQALSHSLCSPAVSTRGSRLRSWAGGSLGALTGTWAGGGPWTSEGLLVDQQHCPGPLPASHHMGAAVTCRC